MKRTRFQRGWLECPASVWTYRFREYQSDGRPIKRRLVVGPISQYPNKAAALRAVEGMRLDVNREINPDVPGGWLTVEQLVAHYQKHELADLPGEEQQLDEKAGSTKYINNLNFRNWIVPHWGRYHLNEVKAVAVEKWLRGLVHRACKGNEKRAGQPLTAGTKAKLRQLMHTLFQHAVRYEFIDRNPIDTVRQGGKRRSIPTVLTIEEMGRLYRVLKQRERTLLVMVGGTGVRRSELFALRWSDIDWGNKQFWVKRSIVHYAKNGLACARPRPRRKPCRWMRG